MMPSLTWSRMAWSRDHALALEPLRHRGRLVGGEAHHGLEAGAVVFVGVVLAADDLDELAQLHLAGGVRGLQQLLLEERVDAALAPRVAGTGGWVSEAESASADFLQHHHFSRAVRRHSDPKHMPAAPPGNAT